LIRAFLLVFTEYTHNIGKVQTVYILKLQLVIVTPEFLSRIIHKKGGALIKGLYYAVVMKNNNKNQTQKSRRHFHGTK